MLFCSRDGLREGPPAAEAGNLRPTVRSAVTSHQGDSWRTTSRPFTNPRGSRLAAAALLSSYSSSQLP